MRPQTVAVWVFVGLALLAIGNMLFLSQVGFGLLVMVIGLVYFGIGIVSGSVHNKHMVKRTRAGQSENE
jgi:hypothetical protein